MWWTKRELLEQVENLDSNLYYHIAFCADKIIHKELTLHPVPDDMDQNRKVKVLCQQYSVWCNIEAVRYTGNHLLFQLVVIDKDIPDQITFKIEQQLWFPYEILTDIPTSFLFIPFQSNASRIVSSKDD